MKENLTREDDFFTFKTSLKGFFELGLVHTFKNIVFQF